MAQKLVAADSRGRRFNRKASRSSFVHIVMFHILVTVAMKTVLCGAEIKRVLTPARLQWCTKGNSSLRLNPIARCMTFCLLAGKSAERSDFDFLLALSLVCLIGLNGAQEEPTCAALSVRESVAMTSGSTAARKEVSEWLKVRTCVLNRGEGGGEMVNMSRKTVTQ